MSCARHAAAALSKPFMEGSAIPVKTDQGRLALRAGGLVGSRAQRAQLIMVDGRRSVDRLAPAMASLGLSWSDLEQLADAGLMAWHPVSRPSPVATADAKPASDARVPVPVEGVAAEGRIDEELLAGSLLPTALVDIDICL